MKKKGLQLIILFASLSLAGIILTQLFWMKNVYRLKEEQLDGRLDVALRSVVTNLMVQRNDLMLTHAAQQGAFCYHEPVTLMEVLNVALLDSLIRSELSWLETPQDYVYGIFHRVEKVVLYSPQHDFQEELMKSPDAVSLECLCKSDPCMLGVYLPGKKTMILHQIMIWLILSILFLLVLAGAIFFSIAAIFKQKRLSQMQTDFVNNMTHEFKTPIATLSLASEMLLKPPVYASPEKTKRYASIIYDENLRLKHQVEQVLNVAALDKGEYGLKYRKLDVHRVLEEVMSNFSLIMKERNGKFRTCLHAKAHLVYADRAHLMNIINNLVDNAIKYSPEAPDVTITTTNKDRGIVISVADKGIGISLENQHNIFRRFYRVPTGNIHNIKGFGLGLFYAKSMVEAHGGTIGVVSELNKGSRFDLFFPFHHELNSDEDEEQETKDTDITG
ncbi:MAG: HAMP domain-containing sensor histidine kinase [Bacteroidales bacterium]|nr:HAMP domain-containing histidine kinase [Lentimicrobiaceae bacterium]MDD5694325.1 HAMP domain-containing sensor histidine kinase [Bacteroidales bacterium]